MWGSDVPATSVCQSVLSSFSNLLFQIAKSSPTKVYASTRIRPREIASNVTPYLAVDKDIFNLLFFTVGFYSSVWMRCKNKFDLYFYTAFSLGACLKLALYSIKNTRVVRGGILLVYFSRSQYRNSSTSFFFILRKEKPP